MADDDFPPLRAPYACVACNKKKVRCIFPDGSRPCLSCRRNEWDCVPRERKRKRPRQVVDDTHHRPAKVSRAAKGILHNDSTCLRDAESTTATSDYLRAVNPLPSQVNLLHSTLETPQSSKDTGPTCPKSPSGSSLLGQDGYLRSDLPLPEIQAKVYSPMEGEGPSADDISVLRVQRVFDLPSMAVRESLIDTFIQRCLPWMPIVERSWLVESETNIPSILLLQAVFLAARKVSLAPRVIVYASPHEFYRRAKTLFYAGYEKDPMVLVAVTCILQWYNPNGPEHVSINTSTMWRHIGVGLAHQIGLHREPAPGRDASQRRRLWWSLYARDCLISSAHGRPPAINLEDCDVRAPRREDFEGSSSDADLFIAYVEICSLLAQVTQCCRRQSMSRRTRRDIESALLRWLSTLPPRLQLFQRSPSPQSPSFGGQRVSTSPYSFEARQLHMPYFAILAILFRPCSPGNPPSPVCILASSAVAWIVEGFLARDEIRFLSPTFIFYILAAAKNLLVCHRYPSLLDSGARVDIETIQFALNELGKMWPSALRRSQEMQAIADEIKPLAREEEEQQLPIIHPLSSDEWQFFSVFAPCISWIWDNVVGDSRPPQHLPHQDHPGTQSAAITAGILAELGAPPLPSPGVVGAPSGFPEIPRMQLSTDPAHDPSGEVGDWILRDWDWSFGL